MLRRFVFLMLIIMASPLAAAPAVPAKLQTVTVYFDKLREKKISGDTKNLVYMPVIGTANETSYIRFRNAGDGPKTILVKIEGLAEPKYDLYLSGKYLGVKTKEKLGEGVQMSLCGPQIPPAYHDFFTRVKTACAERKKIYESAQGYDAGVCRGVLTSCLEWVGGIESGDSILRSEYIIIVPVGMSIGAPYIPERPSDFLESVRQLGISFQTIRQDTVSRVRNADYRNDTLSAMTPMDTKLILAGPFKPGVKATVKVGLTNWTDQLITGTVKLNVPKGWTVKTVAAGVNMPGYGKKSEAGFTVIPPKTIAPKDTVSATADLQIDRVPWQVQIMPAKK